MTTSQLPADPLGRFREVYDALNAERGWFQGASTLRFAAMTAMCCPGTGRETAGGIRKVADEIKKESGWFGPLNSELRFIVGAMLLQRGDSAHAFLVEVKRVNQFFRDESLRRSGIYETMAILILRLAADLKPIERATVRRFKAIYEEMKRHHWWLTGPDDFPACGILTTSRTETPREIGEGTERIYQALSSQGFAKGDPLQTAANILYLADCSANELGFRYRALADGFKQAGISIWQSDYDELAILSFLGHSANEVVQKVVDYREDMKVLRPQPDRLLTFNLASSIAFLDLVRLDRDMKTITDAKALLDMQAIIQAQQAAAAAAASSAAVAASTTSSGT